MGRTLDEIIATLPRERRKRVDDRFAELVDEVESLASLRRAVGKAQAEIATAMKIKQPSVSKIEKQTDMYLSTLRNYVEALGGELDLVVRFPSRVPVRVGALSDLASADAIALGESPRQQKQWKRPG
ncbi:XRE family transcriptional regulator [Afifella sp. YEN Y35]|uniref:XRE family transcriptional regulator n=1 Tax=Afifella sp. YEN Y35 TaxID=3388337 RepID=UPI0039E0F52B